MNNSMDKVIENNLDDFDFNGKSDSKYEFTSRTTNEEIKNIRLQPEQIEEINNDDYSLLLFNATRVEPLSLNQIKKLFPEPSSKKAKSVMDRFISCGLVRITSSGKYYSNYPDHYIDYSLYKYDAVLEAKKDARVFELMKENCNSKTYWDNKSYFSEDGFFTKEQSQEIAQALNEVRLKVKKFSSENRKKKKMADLIFRRFKYYDMILGLFLLALSFTLTSVPNKSFAQGNDPGSIQVNQILNGDDFRLQDTWQRYNINPLKTDEIVDQMINRRSIELLGGNDPGAGKLMQETLLRASARNFDFKSVSFNEISEVLPSIIINPDSGGGHDPGKPEDNITVITTPVKNAFNCGEEIEDNRGFISGLSLLCKNALLHSSAQECAETGDKNYCDTVDKILGAESL